MENETQNVSLIDEDGLETSFEHVLTFMYDGEKYVALSPVTDDGDDNEAEIIMLKVVREGDEDTYVSIDNEALMDEVFAEFLDLMDEIDEESDEEE